VINTAGSIDVSNANASWNVWAATGLYPAFRKDPDAAAVTDGRGSTTMIGEVIGA
jgi:hypothetical protein